MPKVLTTVLNDGDAPARRVARSLAAAALLPTLLAFLVSPALSQQPAPTPAQRPATPPAPNQTTPAPRTGAAAPLALPATPPAAPRQATPPGVPPSRTPRAPNAARAPRPPVAPREVITVVHRLSGWKLLALLASARPARLVAVDELPFNEEVHTNIVAGYISDDGRTVVAHLPRAEAEAASINFPAQPFGAGAAGPELMVVRGDGRVFDAKFIGLDASTGLSFLEVSEPLVPPAPDAPPAPPLAEGQRVHLFAPAPMDIEPQTLTPQAVTPAAPPANAEVVGDVGVVYSLMGAVEGRLSEVKRAPTGRAIRATVRTGLLRPEHAGAIAVNDSGALVGIMTHHSEEGAARLVPAESVRSARERVLARRASVPQPWLGARGHAVALSPIDNLLARGWPRERAAQLLNRRLGVLLTSVAPGTPAARAGLLPGDIVARVSEREVRGLEEFSFFLNEAGVGSTLDFTVLRAQKPDPLRLTVELSGARNPASATTDAEARARAQSDGSRARVEASNLRALLEEARREEAQARAAVARAHAQEADARARSDERLLAEAQARAAEAAEKLDAARARVESAARRFDEAQAALTRATARGAAANFPRFDQEAAPLVEGLETIAVSPRLASSLRAARGGLLVINVRPQSPAHSAGLRVGDIIETADGRPVLTGERRQQPASADVRAVTLGVVREGQKIVVEVNAPGGKR